jgi:hypothetical protein
MMGQSGRLLPSHASAKMPQSSDQSLELGCTRLQSPIWASANSFTLALLRFWSLHSLSSSRTRSNEKPRSRARRPLHQIEAVELMLAMNKFTASYARSLLAATPQAELVEPSKRKRVKGLTEKQMLLMQRESAKLDRQFKLIEQTYGNDHLDLVLVNGYIAKLLANARIVKFLTQHYAEILTEFQKIVDAKSAAA